MDESTFVTRAGSVRKRVERARGDPILLGVGRASPPILRLAPLTMPVTMRPLLCALLFVALTACGGGGSSPSSAGTPTPAPPATPIAANGALPASGQIYLGIYPDPSGLARGDSATNLDAFEAQLGRRFALDDSFLSFSRKFLTRLQIDDYDHDRIPIYSWNCGPSNATIAAGTYDSTLRLQADAIVAYGWPVFVQYMYDPNLPSTIGARATCYDPATDEPNDVFSPTEFVAAWTHIRAVFAQEGAVNAIWLWSVSNVGTNTLAYYPGDAQVDWVGIDAFDETNVSLSALLQPAYALVAPLGKPIMISSTGASATNQVAFFTGAAGTLKTSFPLVRAFVYYDAIGTDQDWRITPAAMPSFTTFASDPYMNGFYARP